MSFINKNFGSKPSLLKPIVIVVAILLVVGGAYSLLGKKSGTKADEKNAASAEEVNPSGIDKGQRVKDVADVEEVVAKWIQANPRAIIAAVANMQKAEMEGKTKDAQKNISTKKDELFNDKKSPQYAPSGYDVTVVEFFDYACGYCKKAQATVEELIKEDKKVRIVYKEFPILGQASQEMSTVAIAVNLVDPSSYKKFHDGMMKSNERGKDAALKVAKAAGVNMSKLESALKNDTAKINEILQSNLSLGGTIGINGTPGFVIGEELIPGAFELAAFKEKIAAARAAK
ncbi:MAG: DsbA family protein [Pseudomonadota bacterium]